MYQAGRPAKFLKADWEMAYKHVLVRWEDHPLQVVEFWGALLRGEVPHLRGWEQSYHHHLPASLLKTFADVESDFVLTQT